MKVRLFIKFLAIFLLVFLIKSNFVKGNGMLGPTLGGLWYTLIILPILLISTIFIEFGIIYLFIKNYMINTIKLLKIVFTVNFFTFPITQLFALFLLFMFPNINYFYLIAEILPISLEIGLFLKIYHKFIALEYLQGNISLNRKFFSVFTANLVNCLFGVVLSLLQFPYVTYLGKL
jgi:hypothetical protein